MNKWWDCLLNDSEKPAKWWEPLLVEQHEPEAEQEVEPEDVPQASPPLPASSKMPLSQHFSLAEFKSHDGAAFPPAVVANLGKLCQSLEKIRAHFNRPVHVLSGYRSPAHNKAVGGAEKSQHMYGTACDIVIEGVDPHEVAEYAMTIKEIGGVGYYRAQQFTHVDIRPRVGGYATRWNS